MRTSSTTTSTSAPTPEENWSTASGAATYNFSGPTNGTTGIYPSMKEAPSSAPTDGLHLNMHGNLLSGKEARTKLMVGVDAVADAVKLTLGAAGGNFILEDTLRPYTRTTNDGVSVAQSIVLEDPIENMGANIMKEIASRSDKESNDGTTTATVLAQAILHEGMKIEGVSPMQLKRELEECLPIIFESLDKQKKEITPDEIGKVALIAGEDERLAVLFQEIYQKIGKKGIVRLDNSQTSESHYTIASGVEMDEVRLASKYMADLAEDGQFKSSASLVNPKILITRNKISSAEELNGLAGSLMAQNIRELVIFCDEIDHIALLNLVATRAKNFRVVVLKAPTMWKDWWFEDFALMTGATVLSPETGIALKDAKVSHLGTCARLEADSGKTTVIGIKDIKEHTEKLNGMGEDGQIRASRLSTEAATLFLGAHSDAALSHLRDKAQDARGACFLALQDGVVTGGGWALVNCVDDIANLPNTTKGMGVLEKALYAPMQQMSLNMGSKMPSEKELLDQGVLDPVKVVKNSAKTAISVAAIILTMSGVVFLPKDQKKEINRGQLPIL